jgi:hypothetical protein
MTSSAASRPTANSAHSRILHLDVRFSPTNVIDVPPRQRHPGDYQPGDYVTFSDRLLNQSGMVVGTEGGSGLITKLTSTQIQLNYTMTVKLRGGQIAAAGLSTNAPTKRLAIVGGTRHYEGATGHLVLVENGDETGELTITLRR